MEQFPTDQTEQHIHNDDDQTEHKEKRCIRQYLHNGRGNADHEEKHVDKERADFLRTVQRGSLFFKERGKDHRDQRNPDILTTEERIGHLCKPADIRGYHRAERRSNEFRHGNDDDSIGHAHRNIAQRNIPTTPILCRERLPVVRCAMLLHFINQRMRVDAAKEGISRNTEKNQEINCHIEIVRDRCCRDERSTDLERIGKRGKIHAAADIRPRHHRRHLRQPVDSRAEECAANQCTADRSCCTNQKNNHQTSRLMPDLLHVAL